MLQKEWQIDWPQAPCLNTLQKSLHIEGVQEIVGKHSSTYRSRLEKTSLFKKGLNWEEEPREERVKDNNSEEQKSWQLT